MNLDSVAKAVLDALGQIEGKTVTGNALFIGAKTLAANGGLSQAWADYENNDWSALIDLGITDGAKIIAAVDPALAPIAPLAAAIIIYARHNPAGTLSLAMKAADGHGGGEPGTDHMSGP